MMDSSVLPESWAAVTLETVAEVHDNLREPVNSTERKKRVGPFPYYRATGQVGWIDDFRQDGEFILLGEDGAPFFDPTKDKAYLVSGKCWVNNHAHVLKGREGVCLNRYLLYALNQVNYRGFANGTTRLKLTQAAMRQLPINLAPLAEQHRIVAKIEELFSELDQGVASLKTAREQLKVYRQSLLKNAFEGKLTAAWRAAHDDQLETAAALQQRIARERQARHQQQLADWQATGQQGPKPKPPKPLPPLTAEELAELPDGWITLSVEQLCEIEDGDRGEHYPTKADFSDTGHCLFLNAKNVTKRGFVFQETSFISKEKHLVLRKGTLKHGDMVFTSRGTLGNIALYDASIPFECVRLNSGMFIIRGYDAALSPDFLYYHLNAPLVTRQIERLQSGTAQPQLPIREFKTFRLAIPSKREQLEIVQELESNLSEADQLDQTLATALQQADALRQSILKKAFHGQLVKQAKNEEPATALLERIRAEKLNGMKKPGKQGSAG